MRSQAATLRLAVLPGAGLSTDVVLIAAGAGLLAASAQLSIRLPFTPVPVTGQTFAVLLVGASLGTVRGGSSALLYVLLGIAGCPVYAHAASGFAVISGAAAATWLATRSPPPSPAGLPSDAGTGASPRRSGRC